MTTQVLRKMKPSSPAAMLREGTMPVVRLSLCTMKQKMVPMMAPENSERNCKAAKMSESRSASTNSAKYH